MTTAFKHRPLSEILAKPAVTAPEGSTAKPEGTPAPVVAETPAVPEKYKDKTVTDVIDMHQNSEKRLGQLQNEVGQLRGLVTDLSAIQRPSVEASTEAESVEVSSEELLSDPVAAVKKIVQPQLDSQDAARESDANDMLVRTENAALLTEFGDIESIVATEDFQKFATRTQGRQADFNTAANGEGVGQIRAARRLLEDYADFKTQTQPTPEPTPTEQARAVATEGSTTGAPISSKPQIYEADVIALINSDKAKYQSPSFQAELMLAIKEGRFVKSS